MAKMLTDQDSKEVQTFFSGYSAFVETGVPGHMDNGELWWPAMGLAAEAGEAAGEAEKVYRKDEGHLSPERKQAIIDECGDTLWFMTALLNRIDVPLQDVFVRNVEKLLDRRNQ